MSRYTKCNLKAYIKEINQELKEKGSFYSFEYSHRNGYHAVDLLKHGCVLRNVDCAEPPRILADRVESEASYYLNNND